MYISANELKKRGSLALSEKLKNHKEIFINVRGKNMYVVMNVEDYQVLREYELEKALLEAQADLASGKFKEMSVEEHIQNITAK